MTLEQVFSTVGKKVSNIVRILLGRTALFYATKFLCIPYSTSSAAVSAFVISSISLLLIHIICFALCLLPMQ